MLGIAGDHDDASFHTRGQQRAGDRDLLRIEDDPGHVLDRHARFAIVLGDDDLLVSETETRRARQVHTSPRHVRVSRGTSNTLPSRSTVSFVMPTTLVGDIRISLLSELLC